MDMIKIDKWEVDDDLFVKYITIIQAQYESGEHIAFTPLDARRNALHLEILRKTVPDPNDETGDFLIERIRFNIALDRYVDEIARKEGWIAVGMDMKKARVKYQSEARGAEVNDEKKCPR